MYDEELERSMLFYIIFKQEDYILDEEDFVNERNQRIIKAINQLKFEKKEISILSIKSKIRANQRQVLEYISNLGEYVGLSSVESIYNELINLSKKRKLFNLLQKTTMAIIDCENVDILSQEVIKKINEIEQRNEEEKTFIRQVVDAIDEMEKNTLEKTDYSLYTGIRDLDNIICGLHKEELSIIGARPGVGKTTFALQLAEYIASKGVETAFISLEMSEYQIIQKILSNKTKVNSYRMRIGTLEEKDLEAIGQASGEIASLPFHLITNARTIQHIENISRKLKNKNNLGLLVIDYIQLIKNKGKFNNREQEVADITRTLKLLSLELKIPIIRIMPTKQKRYKTRTYVVRLARIWSNRTRCR